MNATPSRKSFRYAARDAMLGLALFFAFAWGLLGTPSLSHLPGNAATAAEMARVAAFTGPMATADAVTEVAATTVASGSPRAATGPSRATTLALLAGVFAVLFAFNLAFFRHLRNVYVTPHKRRTPPTNLWSNTKTRA